MSQDVQTYVEELALAAKEASRPLGFASNEERCDAVNAMARALRDHTPEILAANAQDMEAARASGTAEGLLDRLYLDEGRVEGMAKGLEDLTALPDSVGRVLEDRTISEGLHLQKVTVPLGLVAMVYEARPNVTSDAVGICIRTGNACILRGGSLAQHSCSTIAHVLADSAEASGFPRAAVSFIETTDRSATDALMGLHGIVDVLIPRGGAGLIRHCVDNARVPVIETGSGKCHVYVHESADFNKAIPILINAKTQRVGVCNACEGLLVDESIADEFLPLALKALAEHDVVAHGDETTREAAEQAGTTATFVDATPADWPREYLSLDISVKVVSGIDEAIDHINRYGTHHSEAIIAEDEAACDTFLAQVDAAAVYANASTRFTDGGEFGLGAEIGISTQKLHARGPFAADALTTYKYEIRGNGQVRP